MSSTTSGATSPGSVASPGDATSPIYDENYDPESLKPDSATVVMFKDDTDNNSAFVTDPVRHHSPNKEEALDYSESNQGESPSCVSQVEMEKEARLTSEPDRPLSMARSSVTTRSRATRSVVIQEPPTGLCSVVYSL